MRARHPPVPQHPTLAQQQADFTNEGAPLPAAVVPEMASSRPLEIIN